MMEAEQASKMLFFPTKMGQEKCQKIYLGSINRLKPNFVYIIHKSSVPTPKKTQEDQLVSAE
jgi:hypothetical protein